MPVDWPVGPFVSYPVMLKPPATLRTMLWLKSTCSTTHHGQRPSWFRGVKRIAYPVCPICQLFSNRLYSTRTRRPFFNSKMFFTSQRVAAVGGVPALPGVPLSVKVVPLTVHICERP